MTKCVSVVHSAPVISGSICSSYLTQSYQLPVLDTMFVRKKHRGKDFGLTMLEDFVDSFTEDALGLRYPLSSFMYAGKLFNMSFQLICIHFLSISKEIFPAEFNRAEII